MLEKSDKCKRREQHSDKGKLWLDDNLSIRLLLDSLVECVGNQPVVTVNFIKPLFLLAKNSKLCCPP